jgi:phosphoribosylamine--glycine ligase
MLRLKTDLVELCLKAIEGDLEGTEIEFDDRVALAVVMAAGGYPLDYEKGDEITGLESVLDGKVFHAGTSLKDGALVTNGGRILAATAMGDSVTEAQRNAYAMVDMIEFRNRYFRKDIGYHAVAREKAS